jgi:acyl-CoA dehydrogenase
VLIANAAADLLGITLPGGTACVVPVIANAGRAVRVPWASWAAYLLVADSAGGIGLVAARSARVTPGENLSGLPSDTVELEGPVPGAGGTIAAALITQLGALARSVQIAAALRRCLDLSVAYARQRRQFGRPLADQPVVQQEIAALAGEVTAADAAAQAAVRAVSSSTVDSMLQSAALEAVVSAKVRTGLAATMGVRSAHQLHGAMGITREYELHVHTRAAWAWRDEYGAERTWAEPLGDALLTSPDGFWTALVPA